jgi:ribosomal protein S18 acetylase RimI-like enzyme
MPLPTLKIATAHGELQVNRATAADFDAVYALMLEAAMWLQSRSIPRWTFFFSQRSKDFIRNRILTAETYLVLDPAEQPIATFTMYWKDEEAWGVRGLDGEAGYIHGLAVSRRAAGKGLGRALLTFPFGGRSEMNP